MKNRRTILILFIALGTLKSCLFPLAPVSHYFVPIENFENNPKVTIFSTPKSKSYFVTHVDMNAQVFIKSTIFENPNEFYLMKNEDFFEKKAKQYEIIRRDSKFYRTEDYKKIVLKIIDKKIEKIIDYNIVEK